MADTYLAVCAESLRDALAKATPADTIHTAFPPGHRPRLIVCGGRWVAVSWTSADTNGRWRWPGKLEHMPSPPDPDCLNYPETKVG